MSQKNLFKKNIIIYIRRGLLELEWISPILEKFYHSEYDIYFYFKSKKAFNKVKKNQFYFNFISKIKKKIKINNFTDDFFLKTIRFFFKKIKFRNLENYFTEKIHLFEKFVKKIDKNLNVNNISFLMTEYDNNDYTIKKLYLDDIKEKPKIIFYPSAPSIHDPNLSQGYKKKIYANCLFLPSQKSVPFWESKVIDKSIISKKFGLPQFQENWKKNFKIKDKTKKKIILLSLNDIDENYKKTKHQYKNFIKTLESLITFLEKKKDVKVLVKQHPNKPINYEKILKKKLKFDYFDKSFLDGAINSNIIITSFRSSASIYGSLVGIPTISLQNHFLDYEKKDNEYSRLGFTYIAEDDEDLKNIINDALKDDISDIFKNQFLIGKKYFNTDVSLPDDIFNEILNTP